MANEVSHPSWVCGLKLINSIYRKCSGLSHPSWVCGLKLCFGSVWFRQIIVTPFVGVWIETFLIGYIVFGFLVTPFVGVWIETLTIGEEVISWIVTPFVGVWIET